MTKKIFTSLSILLLGICLLTSCAGKEDLKNTKWKLYELNGTHDSVYATVDSFTLFFDDAEETEIAGTAACNHFFGDYRTNRGDSININVKASTMKLGPNMEYEKPYFDVLKNAQKYKIIEKDLVLYSGDTVIAKFHPYGE